MYVLRVDAIRKSFRADLTLTKKEVLRGVSFHAQEGEILGFLGPNGAGKTTTIKVILGLIRPDAGNVTIFDRPAADISMLARIGYLPETPYFFPHLSLDEFLTFCGHMSGMAGKRLSDRKNEVLDLVDLGGHRDKRLKAFSKGMLQKAGLAQAILHEPDLLILDEPFSGLDPLGRKMVRDILVDLKRRGRTIFFSSHILPDMEALCDRTCIIREGVIARCVGLDDLMRLSEGSVEVIARGCSEESIGDIRDYLKSSSRTGDQVFLVVREQAFVRPVIQHLYSRGGEILELSNERVSLEDIFLEEVSGRRSRGQAKAKEEEALFTGF
jgi:ABC-2 type transport system ATP-binding protein